MLLGGGDIKTGRSTAYVNSSFPCRVELEVPA